MKLDLNSIYNFVSKDAIMSYKENIKEQIIKLEKRSGKGSDYLGWTNLPSSISEEEFSDIESTAQKIRDKKIDILVVVGIGGSYLGTKAVVDALSSSFSALESESNPKILFAGQNISEDYMHELTSLLKNKEYAIVVISKSGTTTEPAIAFRLLKQEIESKYGKEESKERIIAITDSKKGALRQLATNEGYKTFIIPDDVGGRFSVLTPVGLVPISIAGFDIKALVNGAINMEKCSSSELDFESNLTAQYAAARSALYEMDKKIEILVNYNPKLHYFAEWWKQLYGESEGKNGKGIFPASVDFSSDLHSMGQYIQEGERTLFETVISIAKTKYTLEIPQDEADLDGLNYLAGKRIDEVNKMAELGTKLAHVDGEVPNIRIEIDELNEFCLGELIYFFEKACGISGYVLDVNPFDQPGVEAYKKNMFALLEKPGFESATREIQERLK
ncbi:MAG: glucose-6-phosphate isomerase [Bacteroidales bacterium]